MRLIIAAVGALALLLPASLSLSGCLGDGSSEQRGWLYVANLRSSDISIVDLATGTEIERVPAAENPHEFLVTPAGLLVSNYRSAAVTRLPAGDHPRAQIAVAGEPHGLALAGDLVAVTQGRAGSVALLDGLGGEVRAEVRVGGEPHMIVAAAGLLYAVDAAGDALVEIDPIAATVVRRAAVGRLPEALAVSPDADTVAVANARSRDLSLLDRATLVERVRLPLPGSPVRVAYTPDGRTLAVSLNDTDQVALLDAASGAIRAVIPAGRRPDGLALSPDGRLLYVGLNGENAVAEIRLADYRVLRRLPAGDGPNGILLVPSR